MMIFFKGDKRNAEVSPIRSHVPSQPSSADAGLPWGILPDQAFRNSPLTYKHWASAQDALPGPLGTTASPHPGLAVTSFQVLCTCSLFQEAFFGQKEHLPAPTSTVPSTPTALAFWQHAQGFTSLQAGSSCATMEWPQKLTWSLCTEWC